MKVASLSQCQRLSVASRTSRERADISAYCWDLAHITKTNKWELLELTRDSLGATVRGPLVNTTGTVVLWQRLDRLLGYQHPYGEHARKRLLGMCRDTEAYLAMVFHRFLAGEAKGKKKVRIMINGNEVKPWDPFVTSESDTKKLTPVPIRIEHEGKSGYVLLEPHILPHQSRFSTPEAFKAASGPSNWNQQQGFYIYRSDRMIQSGGWSRLRTVDEHTKLARVALRFSPQLDDAFKVNVAKMKAQLPQQIRDQIEHALRPVIKLAQEAYRRDGTRTPGTAIQSHSTPTRAEPNVNGSARPRASNGEDRHDPATTTGAASSFEGFLRSLLAAATSEEKAVIKRVASRMKQGGSN